VRQDYFGESDEVGKNFYIVMESPSIRIRNKSVLGSVFRKRAIFFAAFADPIASILAERPLTDIRFGISVLHEHESGPHADRQVL